MNSNAKPLWRDLIVVNDLGLHARSAAMVAKAAQNAVGRVWLAKGAARVDAKQVLELLTLAAAKGEQVRLSVDAAEDSQTLERIAALFASGFGE
jgi:phosphocarrier protein HPr